MTEAGTRHHDLVVASAGGVLIAFEAARVEQISEEDATEALDAGVLLGLSGRRTAGRRLRVAGETLLVDPEVRLERFPASALSPTPEFLGEVFRRLGVLSVVRVRDRLALVLDVDAIPVGRRI